jgi:hypothetical protein
MQEHEPEVLFVQVVYGHPMFSYFSSPFLRHASCVQHLTPKAKFSADFTLDREPASLLIFHIALLDY